MPMHHSAFGLDISDTSIEALEIRKKMGKIIVTSFGRIQIDSGIVENGRILDKDKLTAAIRQVVDAMQPRAPKTKSVIVSLPESRTFTHIFQFPPVISEDNMAESIQYKAEEIIPLSFDQIDFDYQILEKNDTQQEVFYVAAFKDTVNDLHAVVQQAGLNPIVFEPESTSLVRALVGEDMFEGVLIADLGARTTIITIYDHRGVRYSENIPLAGNYLTDQIAKKLTVDQQAAEAMKKEVGLTKKDAVAQALQSGLMEIDKNIKRAIAFYQKKTGYVLNKVIICGGTSLLPGLVEFMHTDLGFAVTVGEPLANLEYKKQLVTHDAILYSTVVGLALRGADQDGIANGINFLASEKKVKKYRQKQMRITQPEKKKQSYPAGGASRKRLYVLAGIFVVLVVVFLGVFFWQRSRPGDSDFQNANTTQNTNETNGISVTVYTKQADIDHLPAGALAGRLVTKTMSVTQEFDATGTAAASRTTTGTITIVNNSAHNQPLIATTRFVTPDNVLFRLKTGVTVPAGSSVEAEVYADNPTTLPEVQPARLTIPGLAASLQSSIYGELRQAIGTASGQVTAVSENDIMQADLAMPKQLTSINAADVGNDVQSSEVFVPTPLAATLEKSTTSKKAGDVADSFTITREYTVTILVLSKEVLQEKTNGESSAWEFTIINYAAETGTVTLRII